MKMKMSLAILLTVALILALFPLASSADDEPARIVLSDITCQLGNNNFAVTQNADGTILTVDTSKYKNDQLIWDMATAGDWCMTFGFTANIPKVKVKATPNSYIDKNGLELPVGRVDGYSLGMQATRQSFYYNENYFEATFTFADMDGTKETTFTVRCLKYEKDVVQIFANSMRIGLTSVYRNDFKPVAGKPDCYEMVLDANATMPYTVGIINNNFYSHNAYVDGVQFTGNQYANGFKENVTFTKEKPYIDFHYAPGTNSDTYFIHYVPATWRISVRYSGQPSSGSASPAAEFSTSFPSKSITNPDKPKTPQEDLKNPQEDQKTPLAKSVTKPSKTSISKIISAKGKMKVTWKKVAAAQKITGYELRYRVKTTSKWSTKSFKTSVSSATIKSLKKGKVYQVQVRSYKTVSGVKYYSAWSATKDSGKIK